MSNSPNDAFSRLKDRTRATVPARNKSLTDSSDDTKTEISHSVKTEISQDVIAEVSQANLTKPELAQDIQEREAVRRTLRIDRDIDSELEQVCSKSKITRETFLEAAYLACTQNPDLMAAVLVEAQQRYRQRKQAGEQRKFETMSRKYGGN
ncbi:hypothetical protein [Chamaesiphon sp. VAR_48_metabat_135_sub]|uniref:hypothetical protein n=1 Tax=Chamaesiphon sp. VAR_48_metabat_135_sub TaxID=2964699 RepID=UPI00286C3169|nr:hypothetical protein [Chamaesiphon sp. VAR_48_metabat_135_sub]